MLGLKHRNSRMLLIAEHVAGELRSRPYTVGKNGPVSGEEILLAASVLRTWFEPNDRIAVVSDRFSHALAALFGALSSSCSIAFISPMTIDAEIHRKVVQFDATKVISTSLSVSNCMGKEVDLSYCDVSNERLGALFKAERQPQYPGARKDSPLVVLFTSGSVGQAKMVAHTEASLLAGYRLVRALRFELLAPTLLLDLGDGEVGLSLGPWFGSEANGGFPVTYLSGMPVASISGLSLGIQAFLGGEPIVESPVYNPIEIVAGIEELKAMSLGIPPITGQRLVRSRILAGRDLSSLFVVGLGGSSVPVGLHESIEDAMGCRVITGYGSTELGGVVTTTRFVDPEEERWTTVGGPVPGVCVDIDEDGELLVKSPALAAGYLSESGDLRRLRVEKDWYRTGDVVSKDENGSFRFVGRSSGVIARGGRKIYPEVIEDVLERHRGVHRAAVVGVPSRVAGEEDIVAYIEPTGNLNVQELRLLCLRALGAGQVPRVIRPVSEIPRRQGGKINRTLVRDLALDG